MLNFLKKFNLEAGVHMFLFSNLPPTLLATFKFWCLGCVCCIVVFFMYRGSFLSKLCHTVLCFMLSSILKVKSYFIRSMLPTMTLGNFRKFDVQHKYPR